MDFVHYLQALQAETHIYIQTHDFPDHDAVAAAYGLQQLLLNYKIRTRIIYAGSLERVSAAYHPAAGYIPAFNP